MPLEHAKMHGKDESNHSAMHVKTITLALRLDVRIGRLRNEFSKETEMDMNTNSLVWLFTELPHEICEVSILNPAWMTNIEIAYSH